MNILLTNDDGITAPGIVALHAALQGVLPRLAWPAGQDVRTNPAFVDTNGPGEIMTVAPLTVQSATGHGVTFRSPLMTKFVEVHESMSGIAVDGRPADCTKLAVAELWPERFGRGSRPDLVVSGMNMGANLGINVLYSGTVAAAIEAAFLGLPSVAVSVHLGQGKTRYDVAAKWAAEVIAELVRAGLPRVGRCININIPKAEDGPGIEQRARPPVVVCPMNTHGGVDSFAKNVSPLGDVYYWSAGSPMDFHGMEPGSDVEALLAGNITLTPLHYDMTDRGELPRLFRQG